MAVGGSVTDLFKQQTLNQTKLAHLDTMYTCHMYCCHNTGTDPQDFKFSVFK